MKSITFEDLPWFSFDGRFSVKKDLTIWQSIAYILSMTDCVNLDDIHSFTREIGRIELESAYEYFESDLTPPDEIDESVLNSKFKPYQIDDDLRLLDQNREIVIDHFGSAFSVVYDLLSMETDKYTSSANTTLAIKDKEISGFKYFLFGKGSLKKWKSIELLNEIGIFNIKPRRKVKSSTEENHKKITGMLLYMLSQQPLYDEKNLAEFFWGDQGLGYSKIYNYFTKNYLSTTKSSNFPKTKTVSDYLKKAYGQLNGDVNFK